MAEYNGNGLEDAAEEISAEQTEKLIQFQVNFCRGEFVFEQKM